ncbi:MAG: Fic family protein, partial [Candidatus Aenigmatarchaeota archaeon]
MRSLTKFDVLLYLEQADSFKGLIKLIKRNVLFESINERTIRERVSRLRNDGFMDGMKINMTNPNSVNCLAFLHWMRMRSIDYNKLLDKNVISVFSHILNNPNTLFKYLARSTKLSKPTLLNIIDFLNSCGFIKIIKKKPMVLKTNINDSVFFYINLLGLPLESFESQYNIQKLPTIHSKRIVEKLIKLHVYSTTVTEGNTASERDVERVFENNPVNLTPREITEILNARKAINYLYEIFGEQLNIFEIKKIHKILMTNLMENSGEIYYGAKRVIGSETRFPSSRNEIDYSISALFNFIKKYDDKLNPLILASMAHFIFVTIHPFADGNGRVARLIHSWILLKSKLSLFVFDPNKRNLYFDALERGRKEN